MLYAKQIIMGLLLMAVSLTSCVKDPQDIPPGITESPDFGMKADFGNEGIDISAGTNQWTMLPVVDHHDSLDVYTAIFSKDGCVDQCLSSWTFRFYQALPNEVDPAIDFSNTIRTGEKQLVLSDQELDSFDILLETHPGLFMSGFSFWEDLYGLTYVNEYETIVGYQENLNVCFQSLAYTGCQYTQCLYFDPSTLLPCIVSIEPKVESPRYVSLSVRPEGTPPFQYQWFNEATSQSIVVTVQDSIEEIYAGVIVTDALGNRAELLQTIRFQNGIVDACYFPINLTSQQVDNTLASNYADHMDITYIDEEGVEWRSTAGIQPSEASVTIDQVTSYRLSPAGLETSAVEVSVKVILFNINSGEERWFETSRLTIALSHP